MPFNSCSIPTKEDIINTTMENPIIWDPVESFDIFTNQSDSSYNEQKLAISDGKESIDSYIDIIKNGKYINNFSIQGLPGSGKTWCMYYILLYSMACGLKAITTYMMAKRDIHIRGFHWNKIFCITIKRGCLMSSPDSLNGLNYVKTRRRRLVWYSSHATR